MGTRALSTRTLIERESGKRARLFDPRARSTAIGRRLLRAARESDDGVKITRVLPANRGRPRAALERDGALYDVAALEEAYASDHALDPRRAPIGEIGEPSDFHTRVATLRCAGLFDLDMRLLRGARPSAARLAEDGTMLLAPCDTERAGIVCVDVAGPRTEPRCRVGLARALLGQDALVPVDGVDVADVHVALAALVGDDLSRATPREAAAAIMGYALLLEWTSTARDRHGAEIVAGGAQLGPALVSRYAAPRVESTCGVIVDPSGRSAIGAASATGLGVDEAIAFASGELELRAGDVVALGPLGARSVGMHTRVTVELEGLGALRGSAVPRRAHLAWRAKPRTSP